MTANLHFCVKIAVFFIATKKIYQFRSEKNFRVLICLLQLDKIY